METKITWPAKILIAVIVYMFIGTTLHFYTENLDAAIYDLRICESDSCNDHTRAQFNSMKDTVATLRMIAQLPLIGDLFPEQWRTLKVLPKKIWTAAAKRGAL